MQSLASHELWAGALQDKGFNPSPFWVAIGGSLAQITPLSSPWARLVFNLDIVVWLLALLAVGRNFSIRTALLAGFFSILYFGTYHRLMGNLVQYFWMASLLGGMAMWAKQKYVWSGLFFAYSAAVRVFPIVAITGLAVKYLWSRFSSQSTPFSHLHTFFSSFIGGGVLFFFLGSLTGRGIGVWKEFLEKMVLHSGYLVGERFNIGLRNWWASQGLMGREWDVLYILFMFIVLGVFVCIVLRVHEIETFAYSSVLLYFVTTVSPYYYQILALGFVLYGYTHGKDQRDQKWGFYAALVLLGVLFFNVIINIESFVSLWAIAQPLTEISVLSLCGVMLLGGYWFSRKKATEQ
jgi:hypothetical protein